MNYGGSVYLMTNQLRTVLYTGVTSDLRNRVIEHREHYYQNSFTAKYNCTICVYYEHFGRIEEAIAKEKEIKGWNRIQKNELVSAMNPDWIDLWSEIKKWELPHPLLSHTDSFYETNCTRRAEERSISAQFR